VLSCVEPGALERNMAALAAAAGTADGAPLRTAFHDGLGRVQRWRPPFGDDGRPLVDFDLEHPEIQAALRALVTRGPPSEVRITGAARGRFAAALEAGVELLAAHDSEVARSMNLVCGTIVATSGPGKVAASSPGLIGTVWLFPDAGWGPAQFGEHLLHETVHQTLFLDEMVNTLYVVDPPALGAEDALVTSAIRRVPRPYDRSLHAACVAVELIGFHEHLGDDQEAARLREGATASTRELVDKAHVLSPHGREVLADLAGRVHVAA
jgi:HEXXH motif-containing protein